MDNIEETLLELPEKVAQKLKNWRIKTLERKGKDASLRFEYKILNPDWKDSDIKAKIELNKERYQMVLDEIMAETEYTQISDEQLAAKKRANIRTQY